jgi:hypothetical protein
MALAWTKDQHSDKHAHAAVDLYACTQTQRSRVHAAIRDKLPGFVSDTVMQHGEQRIRIRAQRFAADARR